MTIRNTGEPVESNRDASDPMGSFRRYADFQHQKAKWAFLKDGKHVEMVIVVRISGENLILLVRGDRDEFVKQLKALIEETDAIGIVYVAGDRGDALTVETQSRDGQGRNWIEPILRDTSGKPFLGKGIVVVGVSERLGRLFK